MSGFIAGVAVGFALVLALMNGGPGPYDVRIGEGSYRVNLYKQPTAAEPAARLLGIETAEKCEIIKASFLQKLDFIRRAECLMSST